MLAVFGHCYFCGWVGAGEGVDVFIGCFGGRSSQNNVLDIIGISPLNRTGYLSAISNFSWVLAVQRSWLANVERTQQVSVFPL